MTLVSSAVFPRYACSSTLSPSLLVKPLTPGSKELSFDCSVFGVERVAPDHARCHACLIQDGQKPPNFLYRALFWHMPTHSRPQGKVSSALALK